MADVSSRGWTGGQPDIDVVLGAARQGEVVFVVPSEERDRGGDLVAGVAGGAAPGGRGPCCAPPEPTHGLPCGEGLHDSTMFGVVDRGDGGIDPLFEPGDGLVAFRERSVGDKEVTDVAGRSRHRR